MAHSSLPQLQTFQNTMMRERHEAFGYFASRLTSGRTEGFDGKAKLVIRRAYGY
jgi:transposase